MKEYISRSKDDMLLRKKNRRDMMWRMENEKADGKLRAKTESGLKIQRQTPGDDLLKNTKVVPGTNVKSGNQTPYYAQLIDKFKTGTQSNANQGGSGGFTQIQSDLDAKFQTGIPDLKKNPPAVDNNNLEMITNLAAREAQKSLGNYVGVNPMDITFKMSGPNGNVNLFALDNRQIEGKGGKFKKNFKDQLETYIRAKYAGMSGLKFDSTEFDAMAKFFIDKYGADELKVIPQLLVAGETQNFESMELRRNSYSDDFAVSRMIESYGLSKEQLLILQSVIGNIVTTAEGDAKLFFEKILAATKKGIMDNTVAAGIDYTFEGETKDDAGNLKKDSHQNENRALDDVMGRIIAIANSKSTPDANQMTELSEAFKKGAEDTAKEGNEKIGPGLDVSNKDVMMRYGLFQTVIHEFLHYITHPQYKGYANSIHESDPQLYNILTEGTLDIFALEIWNNIKKNLGEKGDDDESLYLRSHIEGWANKRKEPGFVAPPLKKEWIQHYYVYPSTYAANALKNKVGIDNLKAAFFLGHLELLELDTKTTDKAYKGYMDASAKGEANNLYLMPPSPAHSSFDDYTSTLFQVAFERGIYTKLEGSEKQTAFDDMIAQLGNKSKNTGRVELLGLEKALSESQAAWEAAKQNTNMKPEEKSEAFNKYIADQEKLIESKKSKSGKEAFYADKINYYHKGTQTIVIRDSDSVIALDDSKLEEFITANKDRKLKVVKGQERWETWFKKQVSGTPGDQNTPTANTTTYESFNLPPNH